MMGFGVFLFLVVVVMEMAPSVLGAASDWEDPGGGGSWGPFCFSCLPASANCAASWGLGLQGARTAPPPSAWWPSGLPHPLGDQRQWPGPFPVPGPVHGTRIIERPGLSPSQGCRHFQTACPSERMEVTLGTQFYGVEKGGSTLAP